MEQAKGLIYITAHAQNSYRPRGFSQHPEPGCWFAPVFYPSLKLALAALFLDFFGHYYRSDGEVPEAIWTIIIM